jgi:acyl-CoA hydrolase
MIERGKKVSESAIHDQTAVVFPNDLNAYGTLFGGRVLDLCDRTTTLAIDSVRFLAPAKHGDILVFKASVNRVWRTSMEIGIKVFKEDYRTLERVHIVSAYFTFVALGDNLKPASIVPVIPETEDEKRRYEQAEIRHKMRLKR